MTNSRLPRWPFLFVGANVVLVGAIAGGGVEWVVLHTWGRSLWRVSTDRVLVDSACGAIAGLLWCLSMIPPYRAVATLADRELPWFALWGLFWGLVWWMLCAAAHVMGKGASRVPDGPIMVVGLLGGFGLVGGTLGGLLIAATVKVTRFFLRISVPSGPQEATSRPRPARASSGRARRALCVLAGFLLAAVVAWVVVPLIPTRPLEEALAFGDVKQVRLNLLWGARLTGPSGDMAAIDAVHSPRLLRLLIDEGLDLSERAYAGKTLLQLAVEIGSAESVELLLASEAPVDAVTDEGDTPLILAARLGREDVVWILLEYGADVHKRSSKGQTALHVSAAHLNVEMVTDLLECGARLDERDASGNTPLDCVRAVRDEILRRREVLAKELAALPREQPASPASAFGPERRELYQESLGYDLRRANAMIELLVRDTSPETK